MATFVIGTRPKPGLTSGTLKWIIDPNNDLPYPAVLLAGKTGKLVFRIDGLKIGDTITGFKINAQVESGGNVVTIDAALRAVTNVAAAPTDESIGAMDQVSVTEDTAVAQEKTGLSEVVVSGKSYYLLIDATTGLLTGVIMLYPEVSVAD